MSRGFLVVALFLAVVLAIALRPPTPPKPLGSDAPAARFSATRAMRDLREIARAPHPAGSREHERVRDYLVRRLRELGLEPQVQTTTAVVPQYSVAGTVENVIARLAGTARSQDAILLDAHYDSVTAGPGAADDGSGVAALLETIRAIKTQPPLKHDLIFLFSDAEEDGLIGAAAFMSQHPWARDVRLALNFEARGNSGSSSLFETSADSGPLVDLLAQAVPRVDGNSISDEIYHHMPNDTDLSIIMPYGVAGLNFAFAGHWEAYHTRLDNLSGFNRGSLQQQGEYALRLARAFGNAALRSLPARNEIYFNPIQGVFTHYNASVSLPLAVFILLLFVALLLSLRRGDSLTGKQVLLSGLATILMMALLLAGSLLFVRILTSLHRYWLPDGDVVLSRVYAAALVVLFLVIWLKLYRLLRRRLSASSMAMGALLPSLLLGLLLSAGVPRASYILVWPLLAALLSVFLTSRHRLAAHLLAVPTILILAPLISTIVVTLGLTTLGALLVTVLVSLFLGLLTPQIEELVQVSPRLVPRIVMASFVLLLLTGMSVVHYSSLHPKPVNLTYALDPAAHSAFWSGDIARLDSWSAQYLGAHPRSAPLRAFSPPDSAPVHLLHAAPMLSLPAPEAVLVGEDRAGGVRVLSLHVTSPRGARDLNLWTASRVLDSTINGKRLPVTRDWHLLYINIPPTGLDLKLTVKGFAPVRLGMVDRSPGLPTFPRKHFAPRSPASMQQHYGDRTLLRGTAAF